MFNSKRKFTFENYGGTIQLRLRKAQDLEAVDELDDPFWMATSAPLHQLRCDPVLLERLDGDGNGRIKSDDIRAAKKWLFHRLKNLDDVTRKKKHLALDALDDENSEGGDLLTTARRVLENELACPEKLWNQWKRGFETVAVR